MTRKILGRLLGEATEVQKKKDQRTVLEKRFFLGCVEDRIEIARKSIMWFWGEGIEENTL
jgi:hypothetical protein